MSNNALSQLAAAKNQAAWTYRELVDFHWTCSDTTPDELVAACNTVRSLQGEPDVENYQDALDVASRL